MWQAGCLYAGVRILLVIVLLAGAGIGRAAHFERSVDSGCDRLGWVLPLLYIRFCRKRRLKAFAMQLPFALDLMKSSMEAGHSLLRGLQVVVKEFNDPLGSEFRTVLEQSRLGMPLPTRARRVCSSGCRKTICACWWSRSGSSQKWAAVLRRS